MKLLFLGTGGSAGIPMIGCKCAVCLSTDSHNKRMRPSALLEIGEKKILIDVGPDFRMQALRFGIDHLDGVILTHSHFDHVAGLDELRAFYLLYHTTLPLLVSTSTLQDLKKRYEYLFHKKSLGISLSAQLEFILLEQDRGQVSFCDIPLSYVSYEQGGMTVNGFRYKNFAYISDIRHYPETIFQDLAGVHTLVLSSPSPRSSLMHLSFDEAIAFVEKVGATKTYIMHISHEIDHSEGNNYFPETIELAYDGLSVEVQDA
jgi:phosphoribosyl 1,2-cyclic phosphate phosphodiesterase